MRAQGFADFTAALSKPGAPVPQLVEVVQRPAPWEPDYVAKRRALALLAPDAVTAIPSQPLPGSLGGLPVGLNCLQVLEIIGAP